MRTVLDGRLTQRVEGVGQLRQSVWHPCRRQLARRGKGPPVSGIGAM